MINYRIYSRDLRDWREMANYEAYSLNMRLYFSSEFHNGDVIPPFMRQKKEKSKLSSFIRKSRKNGIAFKRNLPISSYFRTEYNDCEEYDGAVIVPSVYWPDTKPKTKIK